MKERHVAELLAKRFDDALDERERRTIDDHVRDCDQCRALAAELERADLALASAPPRIPALPKFRREKSRSTNWVVATATIAATLFGALWLGTTLYEQRIVPAANPTSSPAASIAPTASPVSSAPASQLTQFRVLVGYPASPDRIPGTLTKIEAVVPDGRIAASRGLDIIGDPAYDGIARIAYWSRTADASRADLTVWDIVSGSAQVVYTSERGVGTPVWSVDHAQLVFAEETRTPPTGRLVRVDVASGSIDEIATYEDRLPTSPIYADDSTVAGYAGTGDYELVDVASGMIRATWPIDGFPGYGGTRAGQDGSVVTLVTNFEASAHPLYVWSFAAPAVPLATVSDGDLHDPLLRPGHSELFFVDGFDVKLIDYSSGDVRLVESFQPNGFGWPQLIAFDTAGEHVLVVYDNTAQIFAVGDGGLVQVGTVTLPTTLDRLWVFGLIRRD